jgi:cyclase
MTIQFKVTGRMAGAFCSMALGAAALVAPAFAGAPPPSKLETLKIADDLYVIHNAFVPGNVTVLITNQGVVLVDDKFEVDVDNIVAEVRKLTNQPIRYVVNTHYHGDHSGGNAKLQAMGVQVIASENARVKMAEANQPGQPAVTIENRGNITLGGKRAEIYHFGRSHTDGDIVVYFPQHRAIAMGDMYTFGDDVPQLIDYSGGGSARAWTSTLDGVLLLDFETVIPGHGPLAKKSNLREFRESTVQLRTRVKQLLAEGKGRPDIEAMVRKEFHWADLHVGRGLDGLIAEMR